MSCGKEGDLKCSMLIGMKELFECLWSEKNLCKAAEIVSCACVGDKVCGSGGCWAARCEASLTARCEASLTARCEASLTARCEASLTARRFGWLSLWNVEMHFL